MRIRWASLALLVALAATGCGQLPRIPFPGGGPARPVAIPSDAADQPTPSGGGLDESTLSKPSRPFAAHFTDPLYYDEADAFSPFGSDEGADLLAYWTDRRTELTTCTTVRQVVDQDEESAGALDRPARNGPIIDAYVIGAGFGLIYLTGHIDREGKQLTLDALRRTYSFYADHNPRQPAVMVRDLEAFPSSDC